MNALGDWVLRLSSTNLPVLRSTVADLEKLRPAEEQVTARQLANIMLRDPLMTVKVLRYSQSRLTNRQPTEVTTVEHAIMMHGVSRFFREFRTLVALEDVLERDAAALDGALAVISRAYHASSNARNFAALRHDMEGEEVMVSALLHDLAELLLWCTEPAIAVQIERMVACNSGLRSAAAQRAVLGFILTDLQLALAREWKLPRLLSNLMDDKQWENARVQTVRTSVSIARHAAHGWYDQGLPDDYKTLQPLLNLPADQVAKWVKQSALQAARQWRAFGVCPAAAWLPALPGAFPIEPLGSRSLREGQMGEVIERAIGQLERAGPNDDQKATVALALYALEAGLGMKRIVLLSADPRSGRIDPRQHVVLADGLAPADLAFEPGAGTLFDRLLELGQAFWHVPGRTDKVAAMLPAALRGRITQAPFFVMGLKPAQRPPGLIYADAAGEGALDEARYNSFKRICMALAQALSRVPG